MPFAPASTLFINENGIRPVWSLLLFVVLVALLAGAFSSMMPPTAASYTPRSVASSEFPLCLALLTASLVMAKLERCPFAAYGLPSRHLLRHLALGLLTGLLLLSGLVAVLFFTHHLAFSAVLLHGSSALTSGVAWLGAFALVALQEDFGSRGYLQHTLTRLLTPLMGTLAPTADASALAFWVSASSLSGVLFMALHLLNSGETPTGILAVGLAGLTFAFSLWRTGSLWWAIGFHTTWDWSQSFLFGTPDSGATIANHLLATHPLGNPLLSGGSAGPEGSLFVFPTLLLACLILQLIYPARTRPPSAALP